MSDKKIKVGLWGIGRAGWGMHTEEIQQFKDEFEIVAGCDIDLSRAEKLAERFPGAKAYSDGEAFLSDPEIELVSVAVRSAQHIDYAIRALNAGKYVFLEKPVALSSAALDKLEAAMKEHPGKLFFRHNRRFEPAFNHVREIIASGILGNVYEIKLCRHNFQYRADWQAIVECGGGQLNNWGPHLVDHALQLLESPVADIWSDLKNINGLGDAEDTVKMIFRGENGRIVDVEISGAVALSAPVYAVYGDRGSLICEDEQDIRLRYLAPEFARTDAVASADTPPLTGSFGWRPNWKWIRKTIMVEPANQWNTECIYHHIYLAIREGVKFPITAEEAFAVVRATEKIKLQNPAFAQKFDEFGK
ncbi:MAG: Gfo/Idh/MocA family oxidoreductase [Lentisphaeria bacterium]|nr:Gfo/Idh/MocA family oxidoreductase [Lentisphaeria bacterium]